MRLLIVDDDDEMRRSVCRMLHGSGFEVTTARDGDDGVAKMGAAIAPPLRRGAVRPAHASIGRLHGARGRA